MRALQDEQAKAAPAKKPAEPEAPRAPAASAPPGKVKRKRRFPYRKVEELEADIAAEETALRELERQMASPDLYREGDRVKEVTRAFEETKVRLAQLHEHWEEAVELN